jgi:hypothetical protein
MHRSRFLLLAAMILAAALTRLLIPESLPNVSPIAAIALFGGAHFASKRHAFLVPLLAMLAGDVLLYGGKYEQFQGSFLAVSSPVYASFALIVCLGLWLRSRPDIRIHQVAGMTLAGSVLFFLVTNFGAWAFFRMYPKTLQGLVDCYVAGIPFFQYTLLGDAVYVTVLFGSFALVESRVAALRRQRVWQAAE